MTSLPEALGMAVAAFVSGFLVGQFVRFRREPDGDRNKLRWELDSRPFAGPWFKVTVVVLFLAAVGLTVQTTAEQRLCNLEFRRTIALRADIAADDNLARQQQDEAVAEMVRAVVSTEATPDGRAQARLALQQYLDRYRELSNRQAGNSLLRAQNPYPEC